MRTELYGFHVVEEYEEVLERNPKKISICWQLSHILFYSLSAISGYVCTFMFEVLWIEIFAGNCPFYAEFTFTDSLARALGVYGSRVNNDEDYDDDGVSVLEIDWTRDVITNFKHTRHCKFFNLINICSCMFGIAWAVMFAMCGRGGYDSRLFHSPWRIVIPAAPFTLVFSACAFIASHDMVYGLIAFKRNLYKTAKYYYVKTNETYKLTACQTVEEYLIKNNRNAPNICQLMYYLKLIAGLMAWSWIGSFILLLARVLTANDFDLLKVTVYKFFRTKSDPAPERESQGESEVVVNISPKKRIKRIKFALEKKETPDKK